ncbi:MAG: ATP-binding cassette domain-containing protein [Candidatus Paceibacterota bacterium]
MLCIRNLNTGYGKKQVLFDVSLDIEDGETVMLIGANGSGKSTLLKAIYRLLPLWKTENLDEKSKLEYNDIDLLSQKPFELIDKGILYIPQKDELFTGITVMQNLEIALLHLKDKVIIKERIQEVFKQFPSLFEKRKQETNQLSGGERKILSLSMAMVNRPRLLLLDEPTAGLAVDKLSLIQGVLEKIKASGTTLLIVEHRIKELFDLASRVIGIKQGKIATDSLRSINKTKNFLL